MLTVVRVMALGLCLLATAAMATEENSGAADSTLVSTKYRNVSMREVALALGQRMHKHIALDPRANEAIDLGDMNGRELTFPQFQSIIALYGFATFEASGVIFVVPDANGRQMATPVIEPKHIGTSDGQWITVVYPVASLDAAQLVPVLRPLMPQSAQLSVVFGRNALLIVDRTDNVRRLIEVIQSMEKLPVKTASADASQDTP